MEPIRVLTVFGTRPEAIKMAPLVKELEKAAPAIDSKVCVTAQHRQMLDQVLEIFQIEPDYDLDIMEPRQTLTGITLKALEGLEQVLAEVEPHIVLVHGDTTTTFVAALAAFYRQVAIGHVEAGLRTYDKYSPFPEEMNRQLTGVMADLHFAPTRESARNLLQERKNPERIFVTGNTAIDAMKTTVRTDYSHPILDAIGEGRRLIFMTAHRRENIGEKMENIFRAVRRIVEDHDDVALVYPVHLNPAVQEPARAILGGHPRVHLIDPLDVVDTHNFMARAYLILTDSGGIQEEAPSLGVPVLVLRDTTERPEGIAAGTLKLAGTDEATVYRLAYELLNDPQAHRAMAIAANPYGDGLAAERIVQAILYHYGRGPRPDEFEV
ncbi:non-hydrolyzing UDP-N-acetylglucosamine 2-epimerase [Effusibacillus pohliae]|uniref:non-hydrolyzing UDP-N-acetylglucosamine 2-epimerase n=1 Tax=Effusibacillus pohliae TaxID=232270 RepID=UPI0003768AEF|nr:UDP-N-acetylglucosamine 2-epimerase (non-hydrolyzing) [Effusibacillus pohliae]